jgi:hypothetical protein
MQLLSYQEIDMITSAIMHHWTIYPEDELDTEFTEKVLIFNYCYFLTAFAVERLQI